MTREQLAQSADLFLANPEKPEYFVFFNDAATLTGWAGGALYLPKEWTVERFVEERKKRKEAR